MDNTIEQYFRLRLEDETLEDIFEDLDLDPLEVFVFLYFEGLINVDLG
jgi:hypothetical protein